MDACHGFEVGAEIEFIEGPVILEESPTISVENKQDLPAWHHAHYIDESSSDESLDHHPEVKTESENQLEEEEHSTSEGLYTGSPLHVIQDSDQTVVWNDDIYNSEDHPQTCPMEETEISHMEIVSETNDSPSPTRPAELYSEITLTQEEDEVELLGKYSYYNAKTQSAGTVKPWVRSHKCDKCGRQFGRLYNLERHMCIKTALTRVNMDHLMFNNLSDMSGSDNRCEQSEESMNRLEKMCAEAQKELHNLQGLYKREDEKNPLLGSLVENQAASTRIDRPVLDDKGFRYRRSFICERCGRRFRSKFNLGFHVCCGDKNMSAPQNTIVIKPGNSISTNVQSCQTNSGPAKPPGKSKVPEGTETFKCQLCGKEYTKQAYYRSHMRWHMKERDLICSVNKSLSADNVDHLLTTIDLNSMGIEKKTAPTFTCQECGRIFNKQCSYSTHTLWHNKRRNAASTLTGPSVNQVVEGQEVKTKKAQDPSISAQHQDSDGAKAVPDTFSCPECGRVFFKRIAYANHSRWHVKERELALSVKAATQANAIGYQLNSSKEGSSKEIPQGYSNLVNPINLAEQKSVKIEEGTVDNSLVESGQRRASTAVPEFVCELEVGTESSHEDLSKVSEVSESVGEAAETMTRSQTHSLMSPTEEPNEKPSPVSRVLPYKLLGRRLKRRRPPHRCRDCGTCFSQSWKLKRHQYESPVQRSRCKKHQCDCGRSVMGSLHFLRHQLGHLSGTAFICAVCGKMLRGYQQLRAHSWVHPRVSQFQCKCGAQFTQLPKYLWHSLLNKTGERGRQKQNSHPKRLGHVRT